MSTRWQPEQTEYTFPLHQGAGLVVACSITLMPGLVLQLREEGVFNHFTDCGGFAVGDDVIVFVGVACSMVSNNPPGS